MNKKLIGWGFLLAIGEVVWAIVVSTIMQNADKVFGPQPNIMGYVAFLLMFVLSVAVTGALILGKPILLYSEGRKKEAVKLFGFILAWLVILMVLIMLSVVQYSK